MHVDTFTGSLSPPIEFMRVVGFAAYPSFFEQRYSVEFSLQYVFCFVLAQKITRDRISSSPLVLLTIIFHVPIVPTELFAQSLR